MRNQFLFGAALAAIIVPAAAYAQETTASVNGQVLSDSGQPVANAKVSVVHTPSGTRSNATTDSQGGFSLRGLRVGGPYTVTVNASGYGLQSVEGLALTIGDTLNVPIQLAAKEIVVTATRSKSRELVTSSQSTFRSDQIAGVVSARRDVRDIARRDILSSFNPTTGGVSIAGGVVRTQRFSIDGVQVQDSFGLNYGGLPSTRGIISIEMIDQLSVKAAPFEVSEGNFQGGAISVVMKSGTNRLHFSAFGDWGNAGLTGKVTRDNQGLVGDNYPVAASKILDFKNYGGSISGPIIKDRLFFSASYEKLSEGTPNPFGVIGSSAPNIVPNLTQATIDNVSQLFTANYGSFAIGGVPTAIAEKDTKYAGKIDWNITSGQRLSASYIHHVNTLPSFGGSSSGTSPNISLQSNDLQVSENTDAEAVQLNSKWSNNFSSELRASYKYYKRGQDAYSGPDFAQFNICTDATSTPLTAGNVTNNNVLLCTTGVPAIRLGPDTPRQANKFNSHILNLQGNATYRAGNHSIKFEADHAYSKLYNLFVFGGGGFAGSGGPQGLYYFDSLTDFTAKNANELALTSTTVGDKNNGYVNWAYALNTVGLQDTWKVTPKITVTAGLRYDRYSADKTIKANTNFLTRYQTLYPGLTNTATLDGRDKIQPRLGFNWTPTRELRVTGGVGLFAGGFSDVFISNNYSNSGSLQGINSTGAAITSIDIRRVTVGPLVDPVTNKPTGQSPSGFLDTSTGSDPGAAVGSAALNGVTGSAIPAAVTAYLQGNTAVLANATTNSIDPKFKIPAQWKYNLSFNWRPDLTSSGLGDGWNLRADVLFSDTQQAARWFDLRAQPLVINGVTQVAPDGRPRYGGSFLNANGVLTQPGSNTDIQLTNTTRGQSRVYAIGVTKDFKDFSLNASYTHQNVKDAAGPLISSTVGSAYGGIATADPNSGGTYGRSSFEVTDQFRAGVEFRHKFFKDAETRFGVNLESRSGQPFSITMFDSTTNGASGRASVFGTALNQSSHLLLVPDFSLTPITGVSAVQGTPGSLVQYGNIILDTATATSLQNLVNATKLARYQGQIAPKNILTGPSYNKIDLHFAQQIPFFGHSKITALFDIENFLNLLNRNWGSYQSVSDTAVVRVACQTPASASAAQTCPNYVYSVYNSPRTTTAPKFSLYAIRAGVRFDF